MSKKPNLMSTQDDDLGASRKVRSHYYYARYKLNPDISEDITIADENTIVSLKGMSITAAQGAITPASGSIQITPEPAHKSVLASGTLTTGSATSETGLEEGHGSANHSNDFLERLSRALPKELREEIFGDLLELRVERRKAGDSRWQIRWITISQLSIAIILGLARRSWLAGMIEWLRRVTP